MSGFKVGDIAWCGAKYPGDDGLYVLVSHVKAELFDCVYISRKRFPNCTGEKFRSENFHNDCYMLFDGELTEQEQVNYALAMMGLLEESN